jgi:hypothetical protein
VGEYRTLLSNAQDILDTLSHFRVMLAEEIRSKNDTKALFPQIQANVNEVCDRIFLSFYRKTPAPGLSMTDSNLGSACGFTASAIPCPGALSDSSNRSRTICRAHLGNQG